ncbi:hypothetical protein Glove_322g16 [Diversispora epigaea]|uniref:Uncharacterized protein n=1 Tax=Diversispora epigaea TaxID=1348612 RepID=A0A397HN16_9GLOM|nr:hypothetical protein Glove_322g16 [Diversispora epigaea]
MFQACSCSNITPFSRTESQIEFWSRDDVRADKEILDNLYKTNLLSINDKSVSVLRIRSDPYVINKARKHARLHGPGAPLLNKIKRTV